MTPVAPGPPVYGAAPVGDPPAMPPWTPVPFDAGGPPSSKRSRTVPVLVAAGVVLLVLIIGGVVAVTRSNDDQPTTASSSASASASAATTEGTVPGDFTTYTDATYKFSIATPSDWNQVSLSDPKAQARIDKMIEDNPRLAAQLGDAATLVKKGIKFMAQSLDGSGAADVGVQSAPGAPSNPSDSDFTSLLDEFTPTLERVGGTVTGHQIMTIGDRRAMQIRYDLPLKFGSTDLTEHSTAYWFLAKDTVYVVTILGDDSDVGQVISTFTIG